MGCSRGTVDPDPQLGIAPHSLGDGVIGAHALSIRPGSVDNADNSNSCQPDRPVRASASLSVLLLQFGQLRPVTAIHGCSLARIAPFLVPVSLRGCRELFGELPDGQEGRCSLVQMFESRAKVLRIFPYRPPPGALDRKFIKRAKSTGKTTTQHNTLLLLLLTTTTTTLLGNS